MSKYHDPRIQFPQMGQEGHTDMSWTACFERTCPIHLFDKQAQRYFPTGEGWIRARERLEEDRLASQQARERPIRVFDGPRRRKNKKSQQEAVTEVAFDPAEWEQYRKN